MKNIIIGTAGHIDHGKTALIRALTGIETDRLKEEKKRGITIDLGFAYLDLPDGERAGIIDVPGHEKFIKNMLAGVGGIDMVLLVIAADEGIMPQTEEHLNILSILQIKKGIIVLTKTDLVDEDWLDMIQEDIRSHMKETFLEDALIVPVSVVEGMGLEYLKQEIYKMAQAVELKDIRAAVRIPVDRVFTVDGFGTVITGTQVEGTLTVGDVLNIYPHERLSKVKNIQMHGKNVEKSYAGQRVAINLSNVKTEDIHRGDVLAQQDSIQVTMLLDVKLNLLKSVPRALKNRARIRFHHGTSEVLGRVILLEEDSLKAGESTYAQLRLEEEVALKTGDHYVLRFYSPVDTIGGGIVLDANPYKHKRFRDDVLEALYVKEAGDFESVLEQSIKKYSKAMKPIEFIAIQLGKTRAELQYGLEHLLKEAIIVQLSDSIYVHIDFLDELRQTITTLLMQYHQKNPLRAGMGKEEFRSRVFKDEMNRLSAQLIQYFESEKVIEVNQNRVALAGFEISFTNEEKKCLILFEAQYFESAFMPPYIDEITKLCPKGINGQLLIQTLIERSVLIKIDANICLHQKRFEEALHKISAYIQENERMTLGECRDMLGTSRKYAVPILEYLDQQKITKKIDDHRILF
ncbi:selenocysteine-specific translation elongation factor [Fusibacter ferrireducens]|uniref:Selenocysteine-specific elongation factor n=1 Tax=Fusibacter ferrireducens TaxID=2785058 RepID=A0ABR9ZR50_9FIRM|nr:selenocysteine-specific translation elongation factor [Fusibacter ferrireducens]MBF4692923.1 selenocysteine-specific translation elongation factor [Fusibacter ferrireducens]